MIVRENTLIVAYVCIGSSVETMSLLIPTIKSAELDRAFTEYENARNVPPSSMFPDITEIDIIEWKNSAYRKILNEVYKDKVINAVAEYATNKHMYVLDCTYHRDFIYFQGYSDDVICSHCRIHTHREYAKHIFLTDYHDMHKGLWHYFCSNYCMEKYLKNASSVDNPFFKCACCERIVRHRSCKGGDQFVIAYGIGLMCSSCFINTIAMNGCREIEKFTFEGLQKIAMPLDKFKFSNIEFNQLNLISLETVSANKIKRLEEIIKTLRKDFTVVLGYHEKKSLFTIYTKGRNYEC